MRGLGALWLNSQPLNIFKQPAELQAGSLETEAGLQRVFLGSGYRKNSPSPREGKEQRRPLLWPQAPDSTALLLCEKLGSFCPEFNLSWLWFSLCLSLLTSLRLLCIGCLVKVGFRTHPCCSAHGYHWFGRNVNQQRARRVPVNCKKIGGTRRGIDGRLSSISLCSDRG